MEIIDYNSKIFKNIFTDYESFSSWYKQTGLSDNEEDCPSKKTFTLIANEYNDSHVCSSVESFKQRFSNDLYTYYKEFEETTKSIDELMNLTDKEISIAGQTIINVADIPENESSTDVETVDYISNQTKNIVKKGNLQIKKEQLSNKRTYTVKTFINRFRHLFIKIISPSYTFVVKEEDEE